MGKTRLVGFLLEESKQKKETLALLANNTEGFNVTTFRLTNHLGLTNTENYKRMEKLNADIQEMSEILELDEFKKSVEEYLGDRISTDVKLISFKNLVNYCNKFSLLFGKTKLFTGEIPEEVLNEMVNYNLNSLKTFSAIEGKTSITDSTAKVYSEPVLYILSTPNNFQRKNVVISNCEVIESPYHKREVEPKVSAYKDNFLLSPLFDPKMKNIYFVIIKIW